MLAIVGIGAGLVSALLFGVVVAGSPLAALLYSASPLPIFIAALGWNHRAGLAATFAGAIAIALAVGWPAGIGFAVIIALPAWWIGYLALLARDTGGALEWYPLGRLLMWIAGTAALITVGSALVMTTDYESYRSTIARIIENLLGEMVRARLIALPAEARLPELAQNLAVAVPVGIGASFVTTLTINLWLAGKIVRVSQRLPRPWPFIPATALPRAALGLLVVAFVTAWLGGFVGVAGAALTGALLTAFMFCGLTFLHDASRGRPWRLPMLISVYVSLIVMQAVLTPLLVLLGLCDTLFGLRRRVVLPPSSNA